MGDESPRESSKQSRHSLLITHYSLLITHYSLLITHPSFRITFREVRGEEVAFRPFRLVRRVRDGEGEDEVRVGPARAGRVVEFLIGIVVDGVIDVVQPRAREFLAVDRWIAALHSRFERNRRNAALHE